MKKITILGSTGSIGTQAINILSKYPDDFEIVAITGNTNVDLLLEQAKSLRPSHVVIYDTRCFEESKRKFEEMDIEVLSGIEGLIYVSTMDSIDTLLNSVVGNIGLLPTLNAIRAKKDIAIANKECLVTAGEILIKEAKENNVKILPIDSEHSAIFQALQGNKLEDIERVIITASGGPFRTKKREVIANLKATDALKHPNWSMGKKISIDSATLMNKGLEVIEAKWLYDLNLEQIDVVVHPESIIHSMIEYKDSSIIAQMGLPTMELPILYALSYPERKETALERLDFVKLKSITFEEPRYEDFPCLNLAFEAITKGGLLPTVLNASNEELVYAYLNEEIKFYDIPRYIKQAMDKFDIRTVNSIDEILDIDVKTRKYIKEILRS